MPLHQAPCYWSPSATVSGFAALRTTRLCCCSSAAVDQATHLSYGYSGTAVSRVPGCKPAAYTLCTDWYLVCWHTVQQYGNQCIAVLVALLTKRVPTDTGTQQSAFGCTRVLVYDTRYTTQVHSSAMSALEHRSLSLSKCLIKSKKRSKTATRDEIISAICAGSLNLTGKRRNNQWTAGIALLAASNICPLYQERVMFGQALCAVCCHTWLTPYHTRKPARSFVADFKSTLNVDRSYLTSAVAWPEHSPENVPVWTTFSVLRT